MSIEIEMAKTQLNPLQADCWEGSIGNGRTSSLISFELYLCQIHQPFVVWARIFAHFFYAFKPQLYDLTY